MLYLREILEGNVLKISKLIRSYSQLEENAVR